MNEGLKCSDEIPKLCQHVIERERQKDRQTNRLSEREKKHRRLEKLVALVYVLL